MRQKSVQGFQTGDMVKALVLKGKKQGEYLGRIAVRASGSFNIQSKDGLIQGISHKCCTLLQRNSGYVFCLTKIALTNGEERKAA
jgi:non-canonical (house-cleaning) NTP pyrophosphatase